MPDNNIPQILIQPLKPALIAGMAQKLQVLVRVQAPDAAPTEKKVRKPYHLALVIDRSGSMSGPPLVEAVRCARHMVDRLEPTDTASLVVFDDRVRTLAPAQPVGDRRALYNALATVHPGGSTNLHGGWQAGANELLPDVGAAALARVILLSDGNANVGDITDTAGIAALCAQAAERGVTTLTYGLGRDFNEESDGRDGQARWWQSLLRRYRGRPPRALRRGVRLHLQPLCPPCPPVAGCAAGGDDPPDQRLPGRRRRRHASDPPARHRLWGRGLGAGRTGDSGRPRCNGCRFPAPGRRYGMPRRKASRLRSSTRH